MLHFNCTIREGKSLSPTRRTDLDHLCTLPEKELCGNCITQVVCVNSEAYDYDCGPGYFCHVLTEDVSTICKQADVEGCICPTEINDFSKDPYSDTAFIYCPKGTFDLYECADGTSFSTDNGNCASANPTCTKNGIFVDKTDCSKYYKCTGITGTNKWMKIDYICPEEQHYDETAETCIDPCSQLPQEFACLEEGKHADPTNCKLYYECTLKRDSTTEFNKVHRACIANYIWEQILDGSGAPTNYGKCKLESSTTCSTATQASECVIPDSWCIYPR